MPAHKKKVRSDTLTIRFPEPIIQEIRVKAKEGQLTLQEYFMRQMSPDSELFRIIMAHDQDTVIESVFDYQARMIGDVQRMAESSGISQEKMASFIQKGLGILLRGGSIEDMKREMENEE